MEYWDLCLKRPNPLPLSSVDFIVVVIKVVTMLQVDRGINRPSTIPISIMEEEFMLMVEVNKGLRKAILPPKIQVVLVIFQVSNFIFPIDKNVIGDDRVGYRSNTSHSFSHKPGGRVRLLGFYFDSNPVETVFMVESRSSCRWDFHFHSYVLTIYVCLY